MAKVIMVQGTMSNAGKSFVVAGLCRIFKQDGYRVAPFKSQNMALNSFITKEGLEMGRAQVMQAEAAGIDPLVCMNPILLKPTTDQGSQVIVNGEAIGNMPAKEYFKYKTKLIPDIVKAFQKLESLVDIIVIEGAGSPAEINLKANDIVNMGIAKLVDAPVLLVGDIDRGGVFAQLLGTLMLLEEDEKERIKGLVINKFRGDKTILDPGITMLEEKGGIPVTGVLPYVKLSLDDEDSLSERLSNKEQGIINIAVVRLPRISNFTDFSAFERIDGVKVQ
ncbi:MAG: cobyric acid synthase, partial [Lachnospiraceae bacterium]|nr:cobyric acid synthase [Lachnospiraceae bacterium]